MKEETEENYCLFPQSGQKSAAGGILLPHFIQNFESCTANWADGCGSDGTGDDIWLRATCDFFRECVLWSSWISP